MIGKYFSIDRVFGIGLAMTVCRSIEKEGGKKHEDRNITASSRAFTRLVWRDRYSHGCKRCYLQARLSTRQLLSSKVPRNPRVYVRNQASSARRSELRRH